MKKIMWIRYGNTLINMEYVLKVVMTNNEKGENVCKLYPVEDGSSSFVRVIKRGKLLDLLDEESVFGNMAAHLKDGDE